VAEQFEQELAQAQGNGGPADQTGQRLSQEGNPHPKGTAHAGGENGSPAPGPHQIEPGTDTRATGIDVSQFQNNIDWPTVKKAGVQFAFIRATEGTTIQDTDFVQNWQNAEKAGVPVGAYHYFTTTSPVSTQVDNFVNEMKQVGDVGQLPPVLDVEDPSQFAKLTPTQSVAMIQQWLDGVQAKLGVRPMLYMSSNFSAKVLDNSPQLDSYKLWVADYTTSNDPIVPKPWSTWNFWQHADNGQVPGIQGDVDLDYFNGPSLQLRAANQ
jgi:lysozyme